MLDHQECVSCGSKMSGKYCAQCGEQRLDTELRSVRHIAKDAFENLTSVDGKIWRTLTTLFLFPGKFDYHYHIGKRVEYLKPITIFFLINVLFVAFSPITDFYVSFDDQISLQEYSAFIKPELFAYIEAQNVSIEDFAKQYDQLVTVLARSLIILQVPCFALLTGLIFYNRHYYSGDHFTFGLNLHSWFMLWIIVAQFPAELIAWVIQWFEPSVTLWSVYLMLIRLGFVYYIYMATRNMYGLRWWHLLWRLPLMLLAYRVSHVVFRFLQLVVTVMLVEV